MHLPTDKRVHSLTACCSKPNFSNVTAVSYLSGEIRKETYIATLFLLHRDT